MFMEQLVDSLLFVQHTWGSGQFKPGEVCSREASCDLWFCYGCSISERLTKEVEFLQGAFESYKSSLHQEMHDKWKVKEEELKREFEDAKQAAIHEISKTPVLFLFCFNFSWLKWKNKNIGLILSTVNKNNSSIYCVEDFWFSWNFSKSLKFK